MVMGVWFSHLNAQRLSAAAARRQPLQGFHRKLFLLFFKASSWRGYSSVVHMLGRRSSWLQALQTIAVLSL